jgi:hypothetical protein
MSSSCVHHFSNSNEVSDKSYMYWKMLIYFMPIWNILRTYIRDILWPFGTCNVHLVHFSGFGTMDQEKSGNPELWNLKVSFFHGGGFLKLIGTNFAQNGSAQRVFMNVWRYANADYRWKSMRGSMLKTCPVLSICYACISFNYFLLYEIWWSKI